MIRGLILTVCVFGVFFMTPRLSLAQQADLSPQFKTDQPHRFRVKSESIVTRSIADLEQEISQTTTLTYFLTRTVSSIEGDLVRTQLRFDRIVLVTQAPNLLGEFEDVIYDTGLRDAETEEVRGRANLGKGEFVAQQYAEVLDPLLGNAISITVNPAGAIQSVEIPDAFGDAELFSIEMISDRFLPLFQIHPEGGLVDTGSQWEQSSDQDSGLGFDVVSLTRWTLRGQEADLANIEVENEFSTGEVRRESGITLQESSGGGEVVWNAQLGVLDSLTSRQAIRMAGTPRELGGGRIELRVRSLLEIKRSPEPWTLEIHQGAEEDSQTTDPETD